MKKLLSLLILAVVLANASALYANPFDNWSAHGIIVNKIFKPTPLTDPLGVQGVYRFEIRGDDNKVHRQLVPQDVFRAYEIGDEFDARDANHKVRDARRKTIAAEKMRMEARRAVVQIRDLPNPKSTGRILSPEMMPETEAF